MKRMNLRQMTLYSVILGIVAPAIFISYYLFIDRYNRELDQRVRTQMHSYVILLAKSSAVSLWNVDGPVAQQLVDAVMENPEVIRVVLKNENKAIFAQGEKPERRIGTILSAEQPVIFSGETIGSVSIEVTSDPMVRNILLDFQKLAIAIFLQLICSVALLLFIFERRLVRPLLALQANTALLADGILDQPLSWHREDELGRLASSLDQMRTKLAVLIAERDKLNMDLELRVEERTNTLNLANSELSQALEQLQLSQKELLRKEKLASLGAMVAGVAHELNTPLGICVTVISTLREKVDEINAEMAQGLKKSSMVAFLHDFEQSTDILARNVSRAAELVTRFKQVSIDRASSVRRPFLLRDVISEVLYVNSPEYQKKQHRIMVDVPDDILLESYPGELGQVLGNLVDNAMLHGFDQIVVGEIWIRARQLDAEWIELQVQDSGAGIPSESIDRIFDPFFTTKLGRGGSGLGLHIIYSIVSTVLGGEIHVASIVGVGSTFTLKLPRQAPLAQA
ncbi:HAMP domain-containing protein [Deefgea tanakiae]|uniref:histidine kinase n=1 Tax=Deefgea tanakiae TaxID=2865840 RepID=A0ABX8Z427_9NEIS|nr:ATP-binding protein [Deefgea tanakiae]QZA77326.1 HAMP domain-containing protein [Deefgea tanakiae]